MTASRMAREDTATQDHKYWGQGWFPWLPLALRMRHASMVVTFQSAFLYCA